MRLKYDRPIIRPKEAKDLDEDYSHYGQEEYDGFVDTDEYRNNTGYENVLKRFLASNKPHAQVLWDTTRYDAYRIAHSFYIARNRMGLKDKIKICQRKIAVYLINKELYDPTAQPLVKNKKIQLTIAEKKALTHSIKELISDFARFIPDEYPDNGIIKVPITTDDIFYKHLTAPQLARKIRHIKDTEWHEWLHIAVKDDTVYLYRNAHNNE